MPGTITLRYKVEGESQAKASLDRMDAAIKKESTNLKRQEEVAEQKDKGAGILWVEIASAKKAAQDTAATLASMQTSRNVLNSTLESGRRQILEASALAARAKATAGVGEAEIQKGAFGALVQMGSKRILRQGAGMVAQQMFNTPGIGQEIGLIVGGALYGGPTIGGMAALGGIAAVGAAVAMLYRNANEGAKQAAIATQQFSKELSSLGKQAAESSTSLDTATKFAERIKTMQEGAVQGAVAAGAEKRKATERSMADEILMKVESWFTGGERKTGYGRLRAALTRSEKAQTTIAGDLEEELLKQRPIDEQRTEMRHRGQLNLIAAQSRPSSSQRDRDVFDAEVRLRRDDLAARQKEGLAEAAFNVKHTVDLAAASDKELEIQRDKLKGRILVDKEAAAAFAKAEADNLAIHQSAVLAMEHQQRLPATYKREKELDEAKIAADQEKFRRKQEDDGLKKTLDAEGAFNVAKNKVQLEGFDLERKNLEEQHKSQRQAVFFDTTKTAGDMANLVKIQEQEVAEQNIKAERNKGDTLRQLEGQTAVVNRSRLASDIEWQERSIALHRQWGESASADIEKVHDAYLGLVKAQNDEAFGSMMKSLGMQAAVARGTATPFDLIRHQLSEHYPNATPGQLDMAAGAQRGAQTAQWLQPQLESLHPLQQFEKYKKDMEEALSHDPKGQEKLKDAHQLLYNKGEQLINSVLGPRGGGQYMDATSYAHSIQSSLIKGDDVTKEQLAELKKLAAYLQQMVRDGLVMKANS